MFNFLQFLAKIALKKKQKKKIFSLIGVDTLFLTLFTGLFGLTKSLVKDFGIFSTLKAMFKCVKIFSRPFDIVKVLNFNNQTINPIIARRKF